MKKIGISKVFGNIIMDLGAYIVCCIFSPADACLMIILNVIEIAFIHKMNMKKHRRSTIFMLNLALSDIFIGVVILTIKIMLPITEGLSPDHPAVVFVSFMRRSLIQVTLLVSIVTNTLTTTERFVAVQKPFIYKRITQHMRRYECIVI